MPKKIKNTPTRQQAVAFVAVNSHRTDWKARAEAVAKARHWGGATKAAFLRQVESLVMLRREAHESVPGEQAGVCDAHAPFNGISIPTSLLASLERTDG